MKSGHSKPPSIFTTFMGFILLLAAWFNLMPYQFGGRAVYLIISGVSMQPTFHDGDLVILHQTETYQIGDIAAYNEPHTGGIVIHRIIAQEGNRFTLLGDNKPHPDVYRPALAEMAGKYWLHLPKLGQAANQFRAKDGVLSAKILMLELGLLVTVTLIGKKTQRRSPHKSNKRQVPSMTQLKLDRINQTDIVTILVTIALISAIAVYFAFSTPLTKTVNSSKVYEHHGTFSYAAQVPPGIYSSDRVQTGEPVFRALINKVTVNFAYEFSSDMPTSITGAYQITAKISHKNGWSSTIELVSSTPFKGNSFNTSAKVDLSQIQMLLNNLEQQTGLEGQSYSLAIVPAVSILGSLKEQTIAETFSPSLTFDLLPLQMQLATSDLEPIQTGQIEYERETANAFSIPIFNLPLEVWRARQIGVVLLVIFWGSLFVFGWLMWRAKMEGEAAWIQFKHGALLVPAQTNGFEQNTVVVEMASFDHLARLAKQAGCIILHHCQSPAHHYWVRDGVTTYHYQCSQFSREPNPDQSYAPEKL